MNYRTRFTRISSDDLRAYPVGKKSAQNLCRHFYHLHYDTTHTGYFGLYISTPRTKKSTTQALTKTSTTRISRTKKSTTRGARTKKSTTQSLFY